MKELEPQIALLKRFQVDFVIVGGVAVVMHGAVHLTYDLDVCYSRAPENLEKLAQALQSVKARLRGAPANLPFILDARTLKQGLNFTFETDIGPLDLLGEVAGIGNYSDAIKQAMTGELFGHELQVISLTHLIAAKRAAGRPKDLLVLPELEAILESQKSEP
ncbi:MAG: nucleotidyltransferase [Acidobacteriota bacterium]